MIEQISADVYEPTMFEDEEKKRILAAIDAKIEGREIVAVEQAESTGGAEVLDLTEMLKASLSRKPSATPKVPSTASVSSLIKAGTAKGAKRAPRVASPEMPSVRVRSRK